MKKYLYAIGTWFMPFLLILAFPEDIPILAGLAFLSFFFLGLVLVIVFLIALFRKPNRYEPAVAISLVFLICMVTFTKGLRLGAQIHLLTNKGRYEAVVARLAATGNTEERERICGDDCTTLFDEPMRVAFHYCHWFLNWKDIVYDPTGAVNVDYPPPEQRLSIYFRRGEHLYGDWYLCHFAD
jgi:hypothetical protein